ncbi:MAG TPA: T9SS type A sorting domain-containing protein, partial [Chitinophagaceae bacterium]|nr:T9SS type A sorting domain-containing protein [Chitinophagaceae bacterium]
LAEIFANGQTLGTVTSCFYKHSGAIRTQGSVRYLDRNITITPQFQPASPVRIRLYFSKAEFDALDADPLSGITTISDIKILKNQDACGSSVSSTTSLINPVYAEAHGTDGYVVQANVSSFSSFYFGSSNLTLPLHLITFTANFFNGSVLLKWETEQERNTDYFVIERNTGAGFVNIGTIAAGGNTSTRSFYDYTDNKAAGLGFQSAQYRLKTIDKDGSFVYSSVVFISFADLLTRLQINPNPVADGIAKVSITSPAEQQANWKIIDNSGRIVLKGIVQLSRGLNGFSIMTGSLSTGIYYLEVSTRVHNNKIKLQKL